jgi:four helix bundle protein
LKEARETKYWLRILKESKLVSVDVSNELEHIHEIVLILSSIVKTTGEDM